MTQDELKALLLEVGKELTPHMNAELRKAQSDPDESSPSASASGAPAGATVDPVDGSSAAPSDGPPPQAAEGSPPPADAGAPPEGSADPAAQGQEGSQMDPAQLKDQWKAEYAQFPLEELKVAYLAVKEALAEAMGQGAGGGMPPGPGGDAGGPPPGAGAPPPAGPAGPPPEAAMKSEKILLERLAKAEKANLEILAKMSEMESNTIKALTRLIERPLRKAETNTVAAQAQTEKLVKKEAPKGRQAIMEHFRTLAKSESISDTDRGLMNRYALVGDNEDKIQHLLGAGE